MERLLCALLSLGLFQGASAAEPVAAPQGPAATLPKAEAHKLRELYTAALATTDSKPRAAFVQHGKKLAAKHGIDALLPVIREGPALPKGEPKPRGRGKDAEKFTQVDNVTVGFSFEAAGRPLRYAVDVPRSYDPQKPVGVLLDPGHGSGARSDDAGKAAFLEMYRKRADLAGFDEWLVARTEILEQIGADGLVGALPEDQVAVAFEAFWRDLSSRFAILPDRLYVAGLSQTGFWSWYLGRVSPDRYAGLAPMSSVTWQVDAYLENYANLPVYVLHGDADEVCKVDQPRATTRRMQELGLKHRYVEIAGAGHDFAVWSHLNEGLTWLAENPRERYPRKGSKALATLADGWCGPLRIDAIRREGDGRAAGKPTARIAYAIDGQRIELTSEGVERATLFAAAEWFDLSKPIEVRWNEKAVFNAKLEPDADVLLTTAVDRADWSRLVVASRELRAP